MSTIKDVLSDVLRAKIGFIEIAIDALDHASKIQSYAGQSEIQDHTIKLKSLCNKLKKSITDPD